MSTDALSPADRLHALSKIFEKVTLKINGCNPPAQDLVHLVDALGSVNKVMTVIEESLKTSRAP